MDIDSSGEDGVVCNDEILLEDAPRHMTDRQLGYPDLRLTKSHPDGDRTRSLGQDPGPAFTVPVSSSGPAGGRSAGTPAQQASSATSSVPAPGDYVFVEVPDSSMYVAETEKMNVNLVSHISYINDLAYKLWEGRKMGKFTDISIVCQDGQVQAHSFILEKILNLCDLNFLSDEETQVIILPEISIKEVESAVLEAYTCGTVSRFTKLLNVSQTWLQHSPDQGLSLKHEPSDKRLTEALADDVGGHSESDEEIIMPNKTSRRLKIKKETEESIKSDARRTKSDTRRTKVSLSCTNKSVMIQHTDLSSSEGVGGCSQHSCSSCHFQAATESELEQHINSQHKGKEKRKKLHTCEFCPFSSPNLRGISAHVVHQHKDRPKKYKCDRCSFATNYLHNVDKHVKKFHLNIQGQHQCSRCPKSFFSVTKLKNHMLVHSEEKNFVCDECAAKFKRKDDLKCHMKIHLPDEIRSIEKAKKMTKECPTCGKKFEKNWKLQRHQKVHNKETLVTVMERAQVPVRWDSVSKSGAPSIEIPVSLPAVQEFIVLTTSEDKLLPGEARIVPADARIVPADTRILPGEARILDESKYIVTDDPVDCGLWVQR